jgi:hypothetical protein
MNVHDRFRHAIRRGLHFGASLLLGLCLTNLVLAQSPDKTQTSILKKTKPAASASLPDWNGVWVLADLFMDKQDSHASVATPPRASTAAKRTPPSRPKFKGEYAEQAKHCAAFA